jgi:hypothetical protein
LNGDATSPWADAQVALQRVVTTGKHFGLTATLLDLGIATVQPPQEGTP